MYLLLLSSSELATAERHLHAEQPRSAGLNRSTELRGPARL